MSRVAVIGDVMLDEFVYGDVHRISPEAASPVLTIKRTTQNVGGAGNVARGIAALDCDVILVGVVGNDRAGTDFIKELGEHSRIDPRLVIDPTRPTTVKTRYVSDQHSSHMLRVDREDPSQFTYSETLRKLSVRAHQAIEEADVVVLSDYCKGTFSKMFAEMLVGYAVNGNKYVIVDTKGDVAPYHNAHCVKLNLCELGFCFDEPDESVLAGAAYSLAARHSFDHVLVTMGERGLAAYSNHSSTPLRFAGKRVRVRDVSGAGDTVVATLASLIAGGVNFPTALERANAAAAIAVSKPGTSLVTLAELRGGTRIAPADDWTLLDQRIREWRGLKIGFANGCFDLLHPGHVYLLTQARAACDKLIVGVNSDSAVRDLKGPDRPVQDIKARCEMLAALNAVDLVVAFDSPDPTMLAECIRPHVMFKGDDYTPDQIKGREFANVLHIIPRVGDGLTTTETINKIRMTTPLHSSSPLLEQVLEDVRQNGSPIVDGLLSGEPWCGECHGPCLRRPRHGDGMQI